METKPNYITEKTVKQFRKDLGYTEDKVLSDEDVNKCTKLIVVKECEEIWRQCKQILDRGEPKSIVIDMASERFMDLLNRVKESNTDDLDKDLFELMEKRNLLCYCIVGSTL